VGVRQEHCHQRSSQTHPICPKVMAKVLPHLARRSCFQALAAVREMLLLGLICPSSLTYPLTTKAVSLMRVAGEIVSLWSLFITPLILCLPSHQNLPPKLHPLAALKEERRVSQMSNQTKPWLPQLTIFPELLLSVRSSPVLSNEERRRCLTVVNIPLPPSLPTVPSLVASYIAVN
jgi:hypothetical protein